MPVFQQGKGFSGVGFSLRGFGRLKRKSAG